MRYASEVLADERTKNRFPARPVKWTGSEVPAIDSVTLEWIMVTVSQWTVIGPRE